MLLYRFLDLMSHSFKCVNDTHETFFHNLRDLPVPTPPLQS